MTGLMELEVEFKLKEDKVPYCGNSYYRIYLKKPDFSLEEGDLERDALALEEFMATIKSRGMGGDSEFRP